jgi:hypothetical protein
MKNNLTELEIGWIAGLLEGEGCFILVPHKSTTGEVYYEYRICCNMTDYDVIEKLQGLLGGKMSGPIPSKTANRKPVTRWQITKREEVKEICVMLFPHMGKRRSHKIADLLKTMEEYPPRPAWKHGTRQGYERKCRCSACKSAHAKRMRDRRAKKKNVTLHIP